MKLISLSTILLLNARALARPYKVSREFFASLWVVFSAFFFVYYRHSNWRGSALIPPRNWLSFRYFSTKCFYFGDFFETPNYSSQCRNISRVKIFFTQLSRTNVQIYPISRYKPSITYLRGRKCCQISYVVYQFYRIPDNRIYLSLSISSKEKNIVPAIFDIILEAVKWKSKYLHERRSVIIVSRSRLKLITVIVTSTRCPKIFALCPRYLQHFIYNIYNIYDISLETESYNVPIKHGVAEDARN